VVPDGLLISQPLHFGDYGGGWMKFLWALLDLATIVVLGSGLYLWFKRGRAVKRHAQAVRKAQHGTCTGTGAGAQRGRAMNSGPS
jgi:uncharacterized iron-regulated membrane protein